MFCTLKKCTNKLVYSEFGFNEKSLFARKKIKCWLNIKIHHRKIYWNYGSLDIAFKNFLNWQININKNWQNFPISLEKGANPCLFRTSNPIVWNILRGISDGVIAMSFYVKWPKFGYGPSWAPSIFLQSQKKLHIGLRWKSSNC